MCQCSKLLYTNVISATRTAWIAIHDTLISLAPLADELAW